jgi:pre-mRNA-processing factor 40
MNEKKQVFNMYKTQKAKEEKEEQRQQAKKNREELRKILEDHEEVHSQIRWRRVCDIFEDHSLWKIMTHEDRKNVFEDVVFFLGEKEKEQERKQKERNCSLLAKILDSIDGITYKTTWAQGYKILQDNSSFQADDELQVMDKEDILITFENHIRKLEKEDMDSKRKEREWQRRQQRKNRECFQSFLEELHKDGRITCNSLWKTLYPVFSKDQRYHEMLGQPGSTPLDLFKFYIDDLKMRLHEEKKIIKEILKDKSFTVELNTTYEMFEEEILSDAKSENLDKINLKAAFDMLLEKAEARERERLKAEEKKQRKRENLFKQMLKESKPPLTSSDVWAEVRTRFEGESTFDLMTEESERVRIFKDFLKTVKEEEGQDEDVPKEKKSKGKSKDKKDKEKSSHRSHKKSKKHRRSRSISSNSDEDERSHRHTKRHHSVSPSHSPSPHDSDRDSKKRKHKKKTKKKRHHVSSESEGEIRSSSKHKRKHEETESEKHQTKKSKTQVGSGYSSESEGEIQDD